MPDAFWAAYQTEGMIFVLAALFMAGVVYGFAGFGSALVFIPVATIFVTPAVAASLLATATIGSAITVLPTAWRQADRPQVLWMLIPAIILLTPGIYVLRTLDVILLRWLIAIVSGITLAAIMLGWRRSLTPSRRTLLTVGGSVGLIGGATGMLGPLIILFSLAGKDTVTVARANTISFLTTLGFSMIPLLALQGIVTMQTLWLGIVIVPTYILATFIGKSLFHPGREWLLRKLGYGMIGAAMIAGLPLWD
ncbi:MAG: sulfite exporter TauE/SafE family protein [Marinosulfonomonas sp.]|nr:sulfite exporter TauE/SafE family protein [Marinosulfonomonas sp.]